MVGQSDKDVRSMAAMVETWRPLNWVNPYLEGWRLNDEEEGVWYEMYEDGAQAMLEALKVKIKKRRTNDNRNNLS